MLSDQTGNCDAFRAELDRVLDSETIRHSAGLRRLLAHLGERTLDGSADELKEYSIGIDVFHKPQDYDPQHDPSVRVLASKLRHKLDEYYFKEGAEDPVQIEIPKGHYKVKFVDRSGRKGAGATPPASEVRKWRAIALTLAALTTVLAVWIAVPGAKPAAGEPDSPARQYWTPDLALLWQPFLDSDRPVVIAIGTPLFTKFAGGFFRSPRINEWPAAAASRQVKGVKDQLSSSYAVPWYGFTGTGEAIGAFRLCQLLQGRKSNLAMKRSNVLTWDDIRDSNIVFLGPPTFISHLKDIPFEEEFVIRKGAVHNLHPRPGEVERYGGEWSVGHHILLEDHALISKFPGLHGRGEILVLGSPASAGTWAAVEYVTQPHHAAELAEHLRLPSGELPSAYQVLVRARFQDSVPTEIGYVTHRVLAARAPDEPSEPREQRAAPVDVTAAVTTDPVSEDPDDPAIWINPRDPAKSLIIVTNKVKAPAGALFVYGLDGKIRQTVAGLDQPNNVDVEYGFELGGERVDIVVATERRESRLRVYSIAPDGSGLRELGAVPVFAGQRGDEAAPMGIALYRRPLDRAIFAIVGRKAGPRKGYLWQYRLEDAGNGSVKVTKVREFGLFSGTAEIEAIAVDDELGYVYYADEGDGIHKWHADPDHPGAARELAHFGREGFRGDREGIAIYRLPDGAGYIVCADQIEWNSEYRIYRREGSPSDPHDHSAVVKVIRDGADSTDGIEVTSANLGVDFPNGMMVAMNSSARNFLLFRWEAVARTGAPVLKLRSNP